ncbi:hypothetical protein RRG08_023340 [Elysia crispata]|uniref:Uncharacterized protein n=1 Tax=Elysia crispata TaxID=231223 RepID=A0AAE1EDI0_9GAST|nr:hypothetical protein RRG08_023340 [Elysia crispata]
MHRLATRILPGITATRTDQGDNSSQSDKHMSLTGPGKVHLQFSSFLVTFKISSTSLDHCGSHYLSVFESMPDPAGGANH